LIKSYPIDGYGKKVFRQRRRKMSIKAREVCFFLGCSLITRALAEFAGVADALPADFPSWKLTANQVLIFVSGFAMALALDTLTD
jgi:hypothetical protein